MITIALETSDKIKMELICLYAGPSLENHFIFAFHSDKSFLEVTKMLEHIERIGVYDSLAERTDEYKGPFALMGISKDEQEYRVLLEKQR